MRQWITDRRYSEGQFAVILEMDLQERDDSKNGSAWEVVSFMQLKCEKEMNL